MIAKGMDAAVQGTVYEVDIAAAACSRIQHADVSSECKSNQVKRERKKRRKGE
jgi:hypothetical protein